MRNKERGRLCSPADSFEHLVDAHKGFVIKSAPTEKVAARQRIVRQRLEGWNGAATCLRRLDLLRMTGRRVRQQRKHKQAASYKRTTSKDRQHTVTPRRKIPALKPNLRIWHILQCRIFPI